MRDPIRINRIMNLIKRIWKKNVDYRLFQLLGNCFNAGDNYYIEDNELEKKLRAIYKKELE